MSNKGLARGVTKEHGEIIIGIYFPEKGNSETVKAHYIINHSFCFDEPLQEGINFVEITGEPDMFFKTIDGVDYWKNDIIKIPYHYSDYQSSHPGRIDMYFNELYYKEAIISYEEDEYGKRFIAKFIKPVKCENHTERFQEINTCFIKELSSSFIEMAKDIKEKGEESEYWFEDEELKKDMYKNGLDNYQAFPKLLGNIHQNPELLEEK